MAEFLPLCDVLFNVISLAGYFCDLVFDIVMSYALLERGYKATFAATISIVVTSLLISQVLSLRWYLHVWSAEGAGRRRRAPWAPVILHCLQLGVLWRYARLFVPVDLGHVKHQVRDLCMLRLVHAFCSAAPMLLLQLHVLLAPPALAPPALGLEPMRDEPRANKAFEELNVISASLSLFSVCWALASFSKNVRLQNVHRLVLTWLGVIFQFLWRLGTVSARVCALTLYALAYEYWVFLVIGLHWVSMFLWLMSPKSVFGGEGLSRARRSWLSALVAAVYVLAYVNLHDTHHRQKMITFYCVMLIENCILIGAWAGSGRRSDAALPLAAAAPAAYLAGLLFMTLYYRYFHVRRLGYLLGENQQGTNSTNASSKDKKGKKLSPADIEAIPGVFNCRFTNPVNGARKKKKPTSFVPPPPAPPAPAAAFWRRPLPSAHNHHGGSSSNEGSSAGSRVNIQQKLQEKKMKQLAELRVIEEEIRQGKLQATKPVPAEEIYSSLQREPIPRSKTHAEPPTWPSDITHPYQNYPVLPSCNIYPTYTEIKPGGEYPGSMEITTYGSNQNVNLTSELNDPLQLRLPSNLYVLNDHPIPTVYENPNLNFENFTSSRNIPDKRITYCDREVSYSGYPDLGNMYSVGNLGYGGKGYKGKEGRRLRCRTPEILLAPHYLECKQACCNWGAPQNFMSRKKEGGSGGESGPDVRDTPRPPSDIESQISLPRSYTLPCEFRYWRRRRAPPQALPSNNSSDGDVDSGDSGSCSGSAGRSGSSRGASPAPAAAAAGRARRHRRRARRKPNTETKL